MPGGKKKQKRKRDKTSKVSEKYYYIENKL